MDGWNDKKLYYDCKTKELRRLADKLRQMGCGAEGQIVATAAIDMRDLAAKVEAKEKIIRELLEKQRVAPVQPRE